MRIRILASGIRDLQGGKEFYDRQEPGVGDYFQDCLFSDIDSLVLYGGIHRTVFGYHRLLSRRHGNDIDRLLASLIARERTSGIQKSGQGGAGQPAARPESDSEGGDNPQPESEGRPR